MRKLIIFFLLLSVLYACKKNTPNNRKLSYAVTLPIGHRVVITYNSDYNIENNKQEPVICYNDSIENFIWEAQRIADANEGYYLKVEYTDLKHYYQYPDSTYCAQVSIDDNGTLLDNGFYKNVIVLKGAIQ
jgi:hypothetical protein